MLTEIWTIFCRLFFDSNPQGEIMGWVKHAISYSSSSPSEFPESELSIACWVANFHHKYISQKGYIPVLRVESLKIPWSKRGMIPGNKNLMVSCPESTWIFQDVPNRKGRLFTHQEQNNRPKQRHCLNTPHPRCRVISDKYLPCLLSNQPSATCPGRTLGVRSAPCVQDFDSERPQPACLQEEMPSPERRQNMEEMRMGMDERRFSGVPCFSEKKQGWCFEDEKTAISVAVLRCHLHVCRGKFANICLCQEEIWRTSTQ